MIKKQNARADVEPYANFFHQEDSSCSLKKTKYFHSAVAIELPGGIRACTVTLPTLQSLGLKMKQDSNNIMA